MRILANNVWGSQSQSGIDQQRDDLWILDMDNVAKSFGMLMEDTKLYAKSVRLTDLDITFDKFHKESRPYYLPGYDKPLEAVQAVFLYPIPKTGQVYPPIYHLLYKWRSAVRAGRGAYSNEPEAWISEDNNYGASISSSWDIPVRFLRGSRPTEGNELITSSAHILKNAWLSSLGLTELDMSTQAKGVEIRASFMCEDILLAPADDARYLPVSS